MSCATCSAVYWHFGTAYGNGGEISTGIKHQNNDPYKERLRTACVLSPGDSSAMGTGDTGTRFDARSRGQPGPRRGSQRKDLWGNYQTATTQLTNTPLSRYTGGRVVLQQTDQNSEDKNATIPRPEKDQLFLGTTRWML